MFSSVRGFIDDLRQSDVGRALVRDRDEKARAARQVLVDRLAVRMAERPPTAAKHEQQLEPLRVATAAARAKFDTAAGKERQAERVKASALHVIDSEVTRLTNDLIASADPRIDDARRAMEARYERDRHGMGSSKEVRTRDLAPGNWTTSHITLGNTVARSRLTAAIRTARHELAVLKVKNPGDVAAAIAAIVAPVESAWQSIGELDPVPAPPA